MDQLLFRLGHAQQSVAFGCHLSEPHADGQDHVRALYLRPCGRCHPGSGIADIAGGMVVKQVLKPERGHNGDV